MQSFFFLFIWMQNLFFCFVLFFDFFVLFFFLLWVNRRLVTGGRICTVLLTNHFKPPNESCETGSEEATIRAISSAWWTCLWWHHRDRVWLICLTAHEQHWCLESDLFYAAEWKRKGSSQLVCWMCGKSQVMLKLFLNNFFLNTDNIKNKHFAPL